MGGVYCDCSFVDFLYYETFEVIENYKFYSVFTFCCIWNYVIQRMAYYYFQCGYFYNKFLLFISKEKLVTSQALIEFKNRFYYLAFTYCVIVEAFNFFE